jgi:release factor glutamine methyltransferase
MTSVREQIDAACETLVRAGLRPDAAATDAAVLARHVLGWDRATLLTHGREAPPASFEPRFEAFVARRAAREPVAMITGVREFWGLEFEVTPDVLVPRPETEFIVEEALSAFADPRRRIRRIIDVGTGTGCLAISLSLELPDVQVIATDISASALVVARRNAVRHGVDARVSFVQASFLSGVAGDADLIVSNPPYVPEGAAPALAPEVVRHEPHTALFGGRDGLVAIREIVNSAAAHLDPGGRLILEFGYGQDADVTALGEIAGWNVVNVRNDLQDIPRVIVFGRH